MGTNLLITATYDITHGPVLESGIPQPVVCGFMDDLKITMVSHVQARWVLDTLGHVTTWARL